jgi:O-antigen/teichoic acid export membrane protein
MHVCDNHLMKEKRQTLHTRATSLNAIALMGNYFVTLVAAFLANPLLCRFLGASGFGTWQICLRLLTFVSASDGRATQALKWTIANKSGSTGVEERQRDIGSALIVWLAFVPLMAVLGGLVVWLSPHMIRGLSSAQYGVVRIACVILMFDLLLLPLRSIPEAVMTGMNQAYRCVWIEALRTVLNVGLMVLLASIGFGLTGMAGAAVVASISSGVVGVIVVKRSLPWFRVRRPRRRDLRLFAGFSIWVFFWALLNKLILSSDILLLGVLSSTPLVTSYAMSSYAVQSAVNLAALGVSAGIPSIGAMVGGDARRRAGAVREEMMVVCWLITAVAGSAILLLNRTFLSLWVGPAYYIGDLENLLMTLMMMQLIRIRSDAFIIDVTLDMRAKVMFGAASTAISILLAYTLGRVAASPVLGVVAGLILGRLPLTVYYPILVRRFLGSDGSKLADALRPITATAVLFASCGLLGRHVPVNSWMMFVVVGAVSVTLLLLAAVGLGVPPEFRARIRQRLEYVPLVSGVRHVVRSRAEGAGGS